MSLFRAVSQHLIGHEEKFGKFWFKSPPHSKVNHLFTNFCGVVITFERHMYTLESGKCPVGIRP